MQMMTYGFDKFWRHRFRAKPKNNSMKTWILPLLIGYINTHKNWKNLKLCETLCPFSIVFPHNFSFSQFQLYKCISVMVPIYPANLRSSWPTKLCVLVGVEVYLHLLLNFPNFFHYNNPLLLLKSAWNIHILRPWVWGCDYKGFQVRYRTESEIEGN